MHNTIKKGTVLLLMGIFTFGVAGAQNYVSEQALSKNIEKLYGIMSLTNRFYMDTVNMTQLTDEAIVAMMEQLDPFSMYLKADDTKREKEQMDGSFEGVGIEFSINKDTLMVVNVISGGPCSRVGVVSGDRIIKVDQKVITGIGLKNTDVQRLLKGPKGTIVYLTVLRGKEVLEFRVERDKIPLNSVDAAYVTADNMGYIRLNRFAATSFDEIKQAMAGFPKNIKGLMLDLRGNGGGLLNIAIDIASLFLEKDQLVVYTEGRAVGRRDEKTTMSGLYQDLPLVLLVDEYSASASEIVSGAMQDWDRGIVVGRRTYGKGLVQNQIDLKDGSSIRLTIARYHTPSGRVIQNPYVNGKQEAKRDQFLERFKRGEQFIKDSIHVNSKLSYSTLKKGRKVYGGGGIFPDVFVPMDTTQTTEYQQKLIRMGVFNTFTLEYLDANRKKLKAEYPDLEKYIQKFVVDDALLAAFVKHGEEKKVTCDTAQLQRSKALIKIQLKALISRDLFGMSAYFQVINPVEDDAYNQAENILKDWKAAKKKYL